MGDLNTVTDVFSVAPVSGSRFVSFAADSGGDVYATDSLGDSVFELKSGGQWEQAWKMPGGCGAGGIATDASDDVYVACLKTNLVDEFTTGGSLLQSFAVPPPTGGPEELTRGPDGKIYGTLFNGGGVLQLDATARSLTIYRATTMLKTEGIAFGPPLPMQLLV